MPRRLLLLAPVHSTPMLLARGLADAHRRHAVLPAAALPPVLLLQQHLRRAAGLVRGAEPRAAVHLHGAVAAAAAEPARDAQDQRRALALAVEADLVRGAPVRVLEAHEDAVRPAAEARVARAGGEAPVARPGAAVLRAERRGPGDVLGPSSVLSGGGPGLCLCGPVQGSGESHVYPGRVSGGIDAFGRGNAEEREQERTGFAERITAALLPPAHAHEAHPFNHRWAAICRAGVSAGQTVDGTQSREKCENIRCWQ